MKITDLTISPTSFGKKYWVVDVQPFYAYDANGKRTDKIAGYRYETVLVEKNFEKVNVKIEGKQLLQNPEGYAEVEYENLQISVYKTKDGDYAVACKATGVHLVNGKT